MYITQNRYCPIPHSPVKNDLVSLAHILSDSTNCPYEQITFSYTKENGTTGKCRGYEFTRNFVDEPYRSAYISAFWSDGRGKIEITVMPGVGCTVNLSANHLTEAKTVDLINQICEKASEVLAPPSSYLASDHTEQDSANDAADNTANNGRKQKFYRILKKSLRIIGWIIGVVATAFITALITNIINDRWGIISQWFNWF